MKELPNAARKVLQQARDRHDPSAAQLERTLAGLRARLGPPPATGAAARARSPMTSVLGAKLLKWALAVAAVGGVLAALVPRWQGAEALPSTPRRTEQTALAASALEHASERSEPVVEPPSVGDPARALAMPLRPAPLRAAALRSSRVGLREARPAVGAAVQPRSPSPPLAASTEAITSERALSADAGSRIAPRREDHPGTADASAQTADARAASPARLAPGAGASDAEELMLIDRAASRLREGDHAAALKLLADHARLYPRGQLRLERLGLRALALCGAGDVERARLERAAFLRDGARTPLAVRVRRACSDEGSP